MKDNHLTTTGDPVNTPFDIDAFLALPRNERVIAHPYEQACCRQDVIWVHRVNDDEAILASQPEGDAFRLNDHVTLVPRSPRSPGSPRRRVIGLVARTYPIRLSFEYETAPEDNAERERQLAIIAAVKALDGTIAFSEHTAGVAMIYARPPATEEAIEAGLAPLGRTFPYTRHQGALSPEPVQGTRIRLRITP